MKKTSDIIFRKKGSDINRFCDVNELCSLLVPLMRRATHYSVIEDLNMLQTTTVCMLTEETFIGDLLGILKRILEMVPIYI